jgi:transcriptional regulator with XRE-family HTH domain
MPEAGQTVGQRLLARRKHLGLTQAQLAQMTGMSQGSIARIETGKAEEVQSSTLIALAKQLKVTADYLLGLVEEEAEKRPRRRAAVKG